MNSKNYIKLLLGIFAVVVIVGGITGSFIMYKDHVIAAGVESKHLLYPQKNMEPVDSFDIVTPFGELTIHSTMYVVHDNDRNVTCWLYDDGISCIPDRFLDEVER